jgi:hypothetical protein
LVFQPIGSPGCSIEPTWSVRYSRAGLAVVVAPGWHGAMQGAFRTSVAVAPGVCAAVPVAVTFHRPPEDLTSKIAFGFPDPACRTWIAA